MELKFPASVGEVIAITLRQIQVYFTAKWPPAVDKHQRLFHFNLLSD